MSETSKVIRWVQRFIALTFLVGCVGGADEGGTGEARQLAIGAQTLAVVVKLPFGTDSQRVGIGVSSDVYVADRARIESINRTWDSRWYAGADYAKLLHEDLKLRAHLRKKLHGAGVSRVVIERPAKKPRVTIYAARPGVVIGKKGQDIEVLKKDLSKMAKAEVALNIVEIRKPEIDATLVAENIAQQL